MKTDETIQPAVAEILARLRHRQRFLNIVRLGMHGLFYGAVAALVIVAFGWLARAEAIERSPLIALLVLPALGVVGLLIGALVPVDDLKLARALDRASSSEDRFASAVQLLSHHRRSRANLVAQDALSRVEGTATATALPLRVPRSAKWVAIPVIALLGLLWLGPLNRLQAAATSLPEISDEQWATLHEDFERELQELPKPHTPQEQEIRKELEKLAELLKEKPEKKDALKEIARLSERVQKQRQSLGMRDLSMKTAARALAKSQALKQFASLLKQGEYDKAATEMQKLSEQLKENANAPDATEFESIAQDMEKLAQELASEEELQQACQNCANAASQMNRESLSKACKNMSDQLKKNSDKLRQCDSCSKSSSLLDKLKQMMNKPGECKGCKNGCSSCQGGNGNKLVKGNKPGGNGKGKGGLKAGWGSAQNWDGGQLAKQDEQRVPDLTELEERNGENSSFKVVSPDERADSSQRYEELFAEFVQKSEADLDLEMVPLSYRDYLRRYFNAIKPPDEPAPTAEPESE